MMMQFKWEFEDMTEKKREEATWKTQKLLMSDELENLKLNHYARKMTTDDHERKGESRVVFLH